jgi:Cd2+/Zn2+-exporting ATPase
VSEISIYRGTKEELLSLAASAEYGSNHPVAKAILAAVPSVSKPESVRELAGQGIIAKVDGKTVLVGNARLLSESGIADERAEKSLGAVLVACDGVLLGEIHLSDTVKPEAASALSELRSLGVKNLHMLTGDAEPAARAVSSALGLDSFAASLRPEDKYAALESILRDPKNRVAYVGDGINDSPSLARANVGIAMGRAGTDSAMEASDIVIMSDILSRLPEAIRIAKKTVSIAKQNIAFALFVKLGVLILGALGFVGMWWGVFADVGVAVLAILNSMRTLLHKNAIK